MLLVQGWGFVFVFQKVGGIFGKIFRKFLGNFLGKFGETFPPYKHDKLSRASVATFWDSHSKALKEGKKNRVRNKRAAIWGSKGE